MSSSYLFFLEKNNYHPFIMYKHQHQNNQLVIYFISIIIIISTIMITANEARIVRKEKMLRLCLWTPCKSITVTKKCPSYLEQSSRRKCKLPNDEIGFYSKCCLYEGYLPAIKETPNNQIDGME
uniref:Uncharacterized protein LOC113792041 isoform X1 n=2 Tax=Dermatophagoides pteronyssinus TaxID=6956 RepID=A0A6P6Y091_DERPT|nr:uncharacterized protein LOC113792041 isoform X1 [Dermatophagoides pteronyssinus]